jgi:hypothetical protein
MCGICDVTGNLENFLHFGVNETRLNETSQLSVVTDD